MAVTRTFSIIKPDAICRNLTGAVTKMLEEAGLRVVASKRIHMKFTAGRRLLRRPQRTPLFFGELCDFMMSEPVVVQVLEGEDAVTRNRDVMGATNPADAAEGTIRKTYALSIGENTVHGSDSEENAAIEIAFFFKPEEIARLSQPADWERPVERSTGLFCLCNPGIDQAQGNRRYERRYCVSSTFGTGARMSHTPHELADEFPNDHAILHELKLNNAHFVTLSERYQ